MHRVYGLPVADVYPLYLAKVEKKGRSKEELDQVISWLTGYSRSQLARHLSAKTDFEHFFEGAKLNPNAESITGVICGVKIQEIEDPLMKKIRFLDKLVDELAKGRPMDKVLRNS
jgi:hypothetical protein